MFLADFHMHTNMSDGKLSLHELVDLYGERGFGAIAITDHLCEQVSVLGRASRYLGYSLTEATFPDYIAQIEEEAERAWHQYRMLVLPGFEITKNSFSNHRSAHLLALGVSEFINPNLDIPDLCREIRAKGGLAIAAHPVSTRKMEKQTYHLWDRRHELAAEFDAWEVASGPEIFTEVLHSGLPMIANSDLHLSKQMSSWKNIFHCEREREAIFQAIRKQELQFHFYQDAALAPLRVQAEALNIPFALV
jgi:predicted metal-dependent phosphoesterase TrpH